MKKALCLSISFLLCMTMVLGAFANTEETVITNTVTLGTSEEAVSLVKLVERISLSSNELSVLSDLISSQSVIGGTYTDIAFDNLTVGSEIPSYEYVDGVIKNLDIIKYFPVYCDDAVIGMFSIHDAKSSSPTYAYNLQFVNEINGLLSNEISEFCIIANKNQVFLSTIDSTSLIAEYTLTSNEKSSRSTTEISPVAASDIENAITKDIIYFNENLQTELDSSSSFDYYLDMLEEAESKEVQMQPFGAGHKVPWNRVAAFDTSCWLEEFPMWDSPQEYGYCWAISMINIEGWYIGNEGPYYDHGYAAELVAAAGTTLNGGLRTTDAQVFMEDYLDIASTRMGVLTATSTLNYLKKGTPLYLDFQNTNYGHIMVGYYFVKRPEGYSHIYGITDSNVGVQSALNSKTNNYTYVYGSLKYEYKQTLIPNI